MPPMGLANNLKKIKKYYNDSSKKYGGAYQ